MTLTDAGPLLAILDRHDRDHERCSAVLPKLAAPLVTTWPVLTEAMYLLGERVGWPGQERLWSLVARNDVTLHLLVDNHMKRMHELMRKYRDLPMDLADASLVAAAESLNQVRIFTLDSDFAIYEMSQRRRFHIIPLD